MKIQIKIMKTNQQKGTSCTLQIAPKQNDICPILFNNDKYPGLGTVVFKRQRIIG